MPIKTTRNTFCHLGAGKDDVEASVLILHNFTALDRQLAKSGHYTQNSSLGSFGPCGRSGESPDGCGYRNGDRLFLQMLTISLPSAAIASAISSNSIGVGHALIDPPLRLFLDRN